MKSGPIHYRRCHLCGNVTWGDANSKVNKCYHCDKSLAPFYYFDDRHAPVQGDETLRPKLLPNEFQPLFGITAYWEGF
ncbi:MAG: hypothetical protein HOO06_02995 [Bdellovibrionaceae bacterium]|nr:hypothetical protein [Pseudobdellovibrionaceae bacterium]